MLPATQREKERDMCCYTQTCRENYSTTQLRLFREEKECPTLPAQYVTVCAKTERNTDAMNPEEIPAL